MPLTGHLTIDQQRASGNGASEQVCARAEKLATISAAMPDVMLIKIMRGECFVRATDSSGLPSGPVCPTLAELQRAAEIVLRKILPDMKAAEIAVNDGRPCRRRRLRDCYAATDCRCYRFEPKTVQIEATAEQVANGAPSRGGPS